MAGSGRCERGTRCVCYDPAARVAGETARSPWCEDCLRVAERDVQALLWDWRDLEQQLPPSLGEWSDGQPGAAGSPAPPMLLAVDALQADIWWVLTAWETVVRDVDRLSDPATGRSRNGWDVQRAVQVLTSRAGRLAAVDVALMWSYPVCQQHRHDDPSPRRPAPGWHCPDCARGWSEHAGVDGLVDLMRLHARARAALGLTRLIRQLPGDCSGCGRAELRQDNGSETVYCGHCDRSWTRDEYDRYAENTLWFRAAA